MSDNQILLPGGVVKYVQVVTCAGRDNSVDLNYMGAVTDITQRKNADEEREALSRSLQERQSQAGRSSCARRARREC